MGVVDGEPDHGAHQLKLHGHVYFGRPEPVHASILVQLEHAVVWVKHVTHQQLEELLRTCRGHMRSGYRSVHFRFEFCVALHSLSVFGLRLSVTLVSSYW